MIRHVVIFKTKEDAPLLEFKKRIENLKNFIPEIKHIEVGVDIRYDKNPSDFCVITEVENIKDLDIYAKHPKHLEVIEFIKPYVIERRVVDYNV
ncbi:Dabb family protein [Caminibacter pacificus]|uniref:Dabb family protein n=1 Tax=Caminibacter pacificus TaxID=1424653 RepID=A0AAJ4UYB3_9BACT|nr:Dabb family protein [Caminibacter pacificus]NPA88368.1 Dabb family protein [Campylobacterota bacterium]QCI28515.1 Dabb family protein [Caminibacter pacificus]ROR40760.1 stress responsive alpha/beta barrel protein [Caminibacter pacificus]